MILSPQRHLTQVLMTALFALVITACLGACDLSSVDPPDAPSADWWENAPEQTASMGLNLPNFSWAQPDAVAGLAWPGSGAQADQRMVLLGETHGVTHLISLTERSPWAQSEPNHDLHMIHIPVEDFHAPTQGQIIAMVDAVSAAVNRGGRVAIHCMAGLGRTGTMLAAWLMHSEGLDAPEAMARIREMRPGSIETQSQEEALFRYRLLLDSARLND